jgi:hypothetical protein
MTQDLSRPTQEILDAYDNTSEHSIAERKALAAALRMLMNQHREYVTMVAVRLLCIAMTF